MGDIIKSYKQLYSHIIDFNNLYAAWRKARKNKRYKISTARFEQNLDVELLSLYRELTAQAYQPGDYAHFVVHEPKRRYVDDFLLFSDDKATLPRRVSRPRSPRSSRFRAAMESGEVRCGL